MTVIDAILPGRRKAKAAGRRSARHVKAQEFPAESEWTPGTLAELSDGPSFTPVKTTGEIPVLAEAQTVLKRDMSTGLDAQPQDMTEILTRVADGLRHMDDPHGTHPFAAQVRAETQRVRDDAPEPRFRSALSASDRKATMPAAVARTAMNALAYPSVDITSTAAGDYSRVMRYIDRITGTTGILGRCQPRAIAGGAL